MKRLLLSSTLIIIILLMCSCGSKSPYLLLSDVVVKLLEEEGLSNCHITYLPEYHLFESSVELSDTSDEQAAFEFGKETMIYHWIRDGEFELDEREVALFNGDENTIKRYLVVGAIGFRNRDKISGEINVDANENISMIYEQYEIEVAKLYITLEYPSK